MEKAYSLAASNTRSVYDTTLVVLALELATELATFDKRQDELSRKVLETGIRVQESWPG